MLYLSEDTIRRSLSMCQVIEVMKDAFSELASGEAMAFPRAVLPIGHSQGDFLLMPGMMGGGKMVGAKLLTLLPGNPQSGRPLIHALMTLFDGCSGEPLAILDGGILTALRTGAASGVATDLLARPAAKVVTILGAGCQGRTQLEAVCSVRDIEQVYVFDVLPEAAQKFSTEMTTRLGVSVEPRSSAGDAVADADIVCTATSSGIPLFNDEHVQPGTHINAIGCYRPDRHEIPSGTVVRAKVVVDQIQAAKEEAGDIVIPVEQGLMKWDDLYAELGEIVMKRKPGRETTEEITLFKSVGSAVQDVVAAMCALENALKLGMGTELL